MAADLTKFFDAGSRDRWMLGDSIEWSMRLPGTRKGALCVTVRVTKTLCVQIIATVTGRELAFGDLHRGDIAWGKVDKVRMCRTSLTMALDAVLRALAIFARGIISPMWVHPARRGELRHVAR